MDRRSVLCCISTSLMLPGCSSNPSSTPSNSTSFSTPSRTEQHPAAQDITLVNNTGERTTIKMSIKSLNGKTVFSRSYTMNDLEAIDIHRIFDERSESNTHLLTVTVGGETTYKRKIVMGTTGSDSHYIVDVKEDHINVHLAEF